MKLEVYDQESAKVALEAMLTELSAATILEALMDVLKEKTNTAKRVYGDNHTANLYSSMTSFVSSAQSIAEKNEV